MGAAAHVGRVGGLAVALGVGTALFAGQGVAWAEDTDNSTSDTTATATSDGDSPNDLSAETSAASEPTAGSGEDGTAAETDPEADEIESDAATDTAAAIETDEESDDPAGAGETNDEDPDQNGPGTGDPTAEPDAGIDPSLPGDAQGHDEVPSRSPTDTTAADRTDDRSTADRPGRSSAGFTSESADSAGDPAVAPSEPSKVAVFANATTLAENSAPAPKAAARLFTTTEADTPKPNLITAVVNVVNSMLDWARQRADATPGSAPQPPFLWALLSFARRELENLFAARTTVSAAQAGAVVPTSMALAFAEPMAAAVATPAPPWPNPQVSASTNFVSWVTGKYVYSDETMANTLARFQVYGTDVGTMWDNGIPDDPTTPYNEHQVLIAVGDTFGSANMSGRWIYNTLFRSSDDDLSDGMTIPNGEWFNGNMFGGAPLSAPTQARPIINRPSWLPNSVTLIPTAGVSLPTPDTEFGATQYVSFMSVSKWGSAGRWTTNYSAIAYSTDNGENFTVVPESVRHNSIFSGNKNFQQSAFVKGDDGYVYVYGTPNGRQGAAYLARVAPEDITDVSRYEYYKKASSGWFGSSSAKWVKGSPSSASAVIGKSGGACGSTKPGNTVSEMSVQYNDYLDKYVALYGDQYNNIVMRTSDTPEGAWSDATVLMSQQPGGIYAPMMHPWSPSTVGTGSDLYWNLSLWDDYNVMLMRTDLTKV
ncbi:MAG: DUF4185 domain-containing protein [Mycolicibacterium sp.]|uniref:DUF4185 domain-containing protein n=1 Tax=Mycolicibacterium sp. TaxID=2320850 RepID=UPI003D099DA3